MNVEFKESEAEQYYLAVPTWGPHPDVPEGLSRFAKKYKLVILSNASNDQIQSNVDKLGAPFHRACVHRAAGAVVQAAHAGLRVHVRSFELQSGRRAARLVQPAL